MVRRRAGFFLLLLVLAASISKADTWPNRLGESDKACLDSLWRADAVVRNPRAEARIGLWELLRATLDLCDRPEVDARFATRAVRLAMILPEYSSPLKQIPALEDAVRRLEALPEPPPELVRALDDLIGPLGLAGRTAEVRTLLNRLVDLRKAVFGERSREAAEGLMNLAGFHASREFAGPHFHEDLARSLARDAVRLIADRPDCGEDYFKILGQYAGVLETLGRKEAADELGQLFYQLSEAARERSGSPPLQRWDEALPQP